mgnify:FL=1
MKMESPGHSIPKAAADWADVMGAYRFLSNPDVDPQDIQAPHRELTRAACANHQVVLAVTDITELNYTSHPSTVGLGRLGNGRQQGLQQVSTLAVSTEGGIIGVLRQQWYARPEAPPNESRAQRHGRWCESDVWKDAINAQGDWGTGEQGAHPRCINVFDRGGDCYSALTACRDQRKGFLIRANHDRSLTDEPAVRLWDHMATKPVACVKSVKVSAHRSGPKRDLRTQREAAVSVRFASVKIEPPVNDPRFKDAPAITAQVVYAREDAPPAGDEVVPIDWMLLTSEPVESDKDALRMIEWYSHRWLIEEFHRVEKEGCRLEDAQLDHADDIKRLAAVTAVVAVRMLQLRDLAETVVAPSSAKGAAAAPADDPAALRAFAPKTFIRVVAALSKVKPETLTPRKFWEGIAKRGGWLGRKSDGRPGWKTVWLGWHDVQLIALGLDLGGSS